MIGWGTNGEKQKTTVKKMNGIKDLSIHANLCRWNLESSSWNLDFVCPTEQEFFVIELKCNSNTKLSGSRLNIKGTEPYCKHNYL